VKTPCGLKAGVLFLVTLCGQMAGQEAHSYSTVDVEEGRALYRMHCSVCHSVEGDGVAGVDLRSGRFRRASTDDDLIRVITTGIPGTGMPATTFSAAEVKTVVAYLRSPKDSSAGARLLGDPRSGRELFEGKGACLACHRVAGKGSYRGPDLSDIGNLRQAADLLRSLVDPNAVVLPQNRTVRVVTRGGSTITGRHLNEDTLTLQLIDSNGRLMSFPKSDLREYTNEKTSPMPSYQTKLSSAELADLVSYLLSLKGNP
jgi:putative heme-binding domain-containing protein